ncbi:MAG: methyl-accepting chemotaxis protein [Oscillatoriaceae bacterium SKW80]|nr:methyl-accepting chemotaxis protein [Oscillatoriaceae bacterium SKYG93]MCX8119637.1 methyl-accepting chemotaxis protein [Oscillatoriaceae bacterium SKW80]MDW8455104.1 methyl-accepting chemotaxis protein [Oscillatoriaceae cyanobacterium SKYGB_i_bin93]HIK28122.1 methyl-accepting chemotaxis protein [Oscillatoriaceae cyanobacterium M7585_C2015_266]
MLKYFSKFQNRLIALLIVSTIIPVLIVGSYSIFSATNIITQIALQQIEEKTNDSAQKVITFLDNINRDLAYLSKTPPVQGIVRARENRGIDPKYNSSYASWMERLYVIFLALMEAKPYYYQLSYINENGDEMAISESQNGLLRNIPNNQMKNQANEEYFIETMKLKPGEVYISDVFLNRKNGKIEIPYKPLLRYCTPIYSQEGKKRGIIVATVLADSFLEILQENKISGSKLLVVNADGYYLFHPEEQKKFGFELNNNESLRKDYPERITEKILSGEKGLISDEDILVSFYPVFSGDKKIFIFVFILNKKEVLSPLKSIKIVAFLSATLSLIVVLSLGIIIVQIIVRLIREMTDVVSAFSVQVFSTIEEQERLSAQQSSAVQQTTVTMDQLGASSQKSAEQAQEANNAAHSVLALTVGVSSQQNIPYNYQISMQEKVRQIAEQIRRWNEQVGQIYNIANTVTEIANQTNMLALNAAVEASRAGASGKGFAVIAAEIRKLAESSKESAHRISKLVVEIQRATNAIVIATEEGSKIVENIVVAINDVARNVQTISLNAKEQAIAIQQVVDAMKALNAGAQQSASGISQTKLGIQKLMDAALLLKAVI